jgi:hypothetical protein
MLLDRVRLRDVDREVEVVGELVLGRFDLELVVEHPIVIDVEVLVTRRRLGSHGLIIARRPRAHKGRRPLAGIRDAVADIGATVAGCR